MGARSSSSNSSAPQQSSPPSGHQPCFLQHASNHAQLLPTDVWVQVLLQVLDLDLFQCMLACKELHAAATQPAVWQRHLLLIKHPDLQPAAVPGYALHAHMQLCPELHTPQQAMSRAGSVWPTQLQSLQLSYSGSHPLVGRTATCGSDILAGLSELTSLRALYMGPPPASVAASGRASDGSLPLRPARHCRPVPVPLSVVQALSGLHTLHAAVDCSQPGPCLWVVAAQLPSLTDLDVSVTCLPSLHTSQTHSLLAMIGAPLVAQLSAMDQGQLGWLQRLRSLGFSSPHVGESLLTHVACVLRSLLTSLRSLRAPGLRSSCCGSVGGLLRQLPALTALDISHGGWAAADLSLLSSLTALTALALQGSGSGSAGWALQPTWSTLQRLDLSDWCGRLPWARHHSHLLGSLTRLTLQRCQFAPRLAAAAPLAALHGLRELDVAGARLPQGFAQHVRHLRRLHTLRLSGARLFAGDPAALLELSRLSGLTSLSLARMDLGSKYLCEWEACTAQCRAAWPQPLDFLRALGSLVVLDLSSNALQAASTATALQPITALSCLQALDLSGNAAAGPCVLQHLPSLTSLTWLDISDVGLGSCCTRVGPGSTQQAPGLGQLAALPRLRVLTAGRNGLTTRDAVQLAALTGVRHLDLRGNRLGCKAARLLAGMTQLHSLDVRHNQGMAAPASLQQLLRLAGRHMRVLDTRQRQDQGSRQGLGDIRMGLSGSGNLRELVI